MGNWLSGWIFQLEVFCGVLWKLFWLSDHGLNLIVVVRAGFNVVALEIWNRGQRNRTITHHEKFWSWFAGLVWYLPKLQQPTQICLNKAVYIVLQYYIWENRHVSVEYIRLWETGFRVSCLLTSLIAQFRDATLTSIPIFWSFLYVTFVQLFESRGPICCAGYNCNSEDKYLFL